MEARRCSVVRALCRSFWTLGCLALLAGLIPVRLAAAGDEATQGKWSETFPWPVVAIHAHLLPNGKVLAWQRKDELRTTETHLWDPATGKFEMLLNEHAHVFCSGHTFLPDGTLLVAGGHDKFDGVGEKTVTFFDFKTSKWTKGQNMNAGRWYPTTCSLSNGEVLVVGGSIGGDQESRMNTLPQVWKTTGEWRDLDGARGQSLPLYPWLFLAPDGRVFYAGPEKYTLFLDTAEAGAWTPGPVSQLGLRDYGSAVMYEPGKVMIVGGSDGIGLPTRTAEIIDLNADLPVWQKTGDLKKGRRQLNATLLPDGKVLVTGGTSASGFNNATGSEPTAELWDPATGTWTPMASMSERRLYHSTALLLPDGRVLSAGGGMPASPQGGDTDHLDAQIYSPPYLFKGPRPVVTASPEKVAYGTTFQVDTPDAARIASVTLVRLGSVTHAFDQGQRFNRLGFKPAANGLSVTVPSEPEICPPGYYMLFLIDRDGVPSVARMIRIAATAADAGASAAIPDVEILDQDGRKLHFYRDLVQGKTVVLSTLYTRCTAFCPMLGRSLVALQDALRGRDVSFVSISTDPKVDTPERLKSWAAQLGARPGWTLVTGEPAKIDELLTAVTGEAARTGDHTLAVLLLDEARGLRMREFGLAAPARYEKILEEFGVPRAPN